MNVIGRTRKSNTGFVFAALDPSADNNDPLTVIDPKGDVDDQLHTSVGELRATFVEGTGTDR